MAKFTNKDLISGFEFNYSNDNNNTCLFDGCDTVFRGKHIIMPYIANELKLLPYRFTDLSSICNLTIAISKTPEKNIRFTTSDIRLYDPFMVFFRRKMISVIPDGFWTPSAGIRHISISIPEYDSFQYLGYVAESLVEFFKLAMQLKRNAEHSVGRCKIVGCNNEPLYYPQICQNHMYYLDLVTFDLLNRNKNTKLFYTGRSVSLEEILQTIVEGYTIANYDISVKKCILCNSYDKLKFGICSHCYSYINIQWIESDLNNHIITIEEIMNGAWKEYFAYSDKDFKVFLKMVSSRIESNKLEEECLKKRKEEFLKSLNGNTVASSGIIF